MTHHISVINVLKGVYTCVAISVAGQDRRDTIVTVDKIPEIEIISESQIQNGTGSRDNPIVETPTQESLELECFSTAIPTPTIRWFFNNQQIFPDERHLLTDDNQRLKITLLTEQDTGQIIRFTQIS